MLLVNYSIIFLIFLYQNVLELFIKVFKRVSIMIWCIKIIDSSNHVLFDILFIVMTILFSSILLYFKRKSIVNLLCVFFSPIILLSPNVSLGFDVFSINGINFYMKPFIGVVLFLGNISASLGMYLSWYTTNIKKLRMYYSLCWSLLASWFQSNFHPIPILYTKIPAYYYDILPLSSNVGCLC